MGIKISDLAKVPQRERSANTAMTNPNRVDRVGTTNSHSTLLRRVV